jgi:hypothetical protein
MPRTQLRRSRRWIPAGLILLLACPAALAAPASDAVKVQAAAQEFDAGRRAFQLEDFPSAAAHFENAYRDMPSPEALRLAIRAHARARNNARAATLAALASRRYGDDPGTRELAESFLEKLSPGLHRVTVACEPACSIVVDRRAVLDEAATETVFYVAPGTHAVVAIWPGGREGNQSVDGKAGEGSNLSFQPEEPRDEPVVVNTQPARESGMDASSSSGLPPVVTYVGLGLTTVLAGVTIWSGIDTKNNPGKAAVEERCLDLGENCPEYQDGLDAQKRTNVLLGATAGVALTTGVFALLTDWSGGKPDDSARVQPTVFVGGSGVVASGRF